MERSRSQEGSRDQAAEDLVCVLCHEVRNLLAAIQIHCHLLQSASAGSGTGGEAQLIARSASQAGSLLAQVRPLLEGSRAALGVVEPHRALEALGHALERSDRQRVSIASVEAGALPPVAIDSECLHQLLLSGVFAALEKASPGAGVCVSARGATDSVEFVLEEKGAPVRGSAAEPRGGALDRSVAWSIAQAILDGAGAGLEIEHTREVTRITLRIPVARIHPAGQEAGARTTQPTRSGLRDSSAERARRSPRAASRSRSARRVLLVEDRPEIRRFMGRVLRSKGYAVLDAEDAKRALEIASTEPGDIDLLLTDLIMPGMGGIELAEKITSICPEASVLFVSGDRNHPALDSINLPPRSRALFKPFSSDELASAVRDLLVG